MDTLDPNLNHTKLAVVRFTSDFQPIKQQVSLHQTPPPPPNHHNGRHRSDQYMVDLPPLITHSHSGYSSEPNRPSRPARVFTRSRSEQPPQPMGSQTSQPLLPIRRLDQQRTGPPLKNEYVDAPEKLTSTSVRQHLKNINHDVINLQPKPSSSYRRNSLDLCVNNEPQERLYKNHEDRQESLITCRKCGKCKCGPCRTPQELPKTWICNKDVECSLQKTVDVCTCMCCVQFLFQTCFDDSEDHDVADNPCACFSQKHCCKRWTCLSLLSLGLWGLWCYPCAKGGLLACTKCYNCYKQHQSPPCMCHKRGNLQGSNHRLLESESSSTTT